MRTRNVRLCALVVVVVVGTLVTPCVGRPDSIPNHRRHTRHRHDHDRNNTSQTHPVRLTNDLVLKKLMPRLDMSCAAARPAQRNGEMRVRAPDLSHAHVLRYLRRKVPKEFIVAVYKCDDDYVLTGPSDRLYCSRGGWIGRKPVCERSTGLDPDSVLELERLFPSIVPNTEKNLLTTMQNTSPDTKPYEEEDQSLCAGVRAGCDQECVVIHGQPTCVCYPGFVKNGTSCIDIDECSDRNGRCENLCNNTLGSYFCSCNEGFRLGTDGRSCTDINECLLRNGHGPCEDTCTNTPGSYLCSCRGPGASLADDGKACLRAEDVACERAKCSHTCVYARARGEAFCTCPSGMRLGRDYHTCEDINECEIEEVSSTCEYGCVNTPGSYHCSSNNRTNLESNDIDRIHSDDDEIENKDKDGKSRDDFLAGALETAKGNRIDGEEKRDRVSKKQRVDGEKRIFDEEDGYVYSKPTVPGVLEEDQIFSNTDDEESVVTEDPNEEEIGLVEELKENRNRTGKELIDEREEDIETSTRSEDDSVRGEESSKNEERKEVSDHDEDEDEDDDYDEDDDEEDDDEEDEDENGNGVEDHRDETNCTEGYKVSSRGCIDINECEEEDVGCSHDCINTPGSYECSCPSGYAKPADDPNSCEDVNECLEKPCSHVCINEVSTFHCECPAGYDLSSDNRTCIEEPILCSPEYMRKYDLKECGCPDTYVSSTAGCVPRKNCSHGHSVRGDSVECTCPEGFILEEDRTTCLDLDECEEESGICEQVCTNTEGSYTCECHEGYIRDPEHSGKCIDVDECSDDPCSHTCSNIPGSYRCECPDNFILNSDNSTCTETLICSPEYRSKHGLDSCECPEDLIETSLGCIVKKNCTHGYKIDGVNMTCTCPEGYLLAEDSCEDIDECLEENGGCSHDCVNSEGSYECVCPLGTKKTINDTKTCLEIDPCSIDNGGCDQICKNVDGNARCLCLDGFEVDGSKCKELIDPCNVLNCSYGCVESNGTARCSCPDDQILNGTECLSDPCLEDNGGCSHLCSNIDGQAVCTCPTDQYVLEDRTCVEKDPCGIDNGGCSHFCRTVKGNPKCFCPLDQDWILHGKICISGKDPCSNNGGCSHTCTPVSGKPVCSCPIDSGLILRGKICVPVDPCKVNNGGCSHECSVVDQKVVCKCPSGYELIRKTCIEIDPCERDNGGCSHFCDIDDNDTIICACPSGMYLDGKSCTTTNPCLVNNGNCTTGRCEIIDSRPICVEVPTEGSDINMCRINNGNCSHTCTWNQSRGITCVCPEGYDLGSDRRTCERDEICECSHGCRVEGTRVTCVCPERYELRGKTCYVIDPCSIDNGGCSDLCRVTNGTAECFCPDGYELVDNGCFREDPCVVDNGGCSHGCLNADGIARCVCPDMHVLEDRKCRPVDPCTYRNGNCDQKCVYVDGIVTCECYEGHVRSNNICVPIDPCRINNGGCSHICTHSNGTVVCECPRGYDRIEGKCFKVDKCRINNGGCSHTCTYRDGTVLCRCPVGFRLTDDRKTCVRIEGLLCPNCSHGCVDISGSIRCQCPAGYELRDETTCVKIDPCRIRNGGCSHFCKSINGRVKCLCPLYHVLEDKQCRAIDPCEINNGGCTHICLKGDEGRAVCQCPPGYQLEYGTQCRYVDPCSISNGNCDQICNSYDGFVRCGCRNGYELTDGKYCKKSDPCRVDNGGCSHGCRTSNGSVECSCPKGYVLRDQTTCIRSDPCGDSNGNCTDICRNVDGVAECLCFKGRSLSVDQRTCTSIDPCSIDNGNCSDVCRHVDGTVECSCSTGRTLGIDHRTCVDYDPCRIGNGGCAHVCELIKKIPHCFCNPGYYLSFDQKTCLRIDPCLANNGGCSDICEAEDGRAKCSCYVGSYLGSDRKTCIKHDSCRLSNGGCEQRCVDLDAGGYRCVCRRGYILSPDSKSCLKINKEKTCPTLKAPENGYVKCLGEYRDRVPAGSQCVVWCNKGYKLNGAPLMTCNSTGTWGKNPICIPVSCPKLTAPDNGRLMPVTCSTAKTFPGQKCMLSCRRGFRPIRPRVPFVCLPSLQWSVPDAEKITKGFCIKAAEAPKPTIRCPNAGVISVTLPIGDSSAYVRIPRPESNMDWWRHVTAKPEWGKLPGIKLPAGTHDVVFTAWSPEADMSASCNLKIDVQDVEPPRATLCPDSMHVVLRANEHKRKIHWQEPEFADNVAITKIYRSMEPGMYLAPGVYHVSYVASDSAGNNARCLFAIAIKPSEMINDSPKPYRSVLVCPGSIQIIPQHEHKPKPASGCYYRHVRQHRMRQHPTYASSNARRTWTRCCG